jgi:hypothetical protein
MSDTKVPNLFHHSPEAPVNVAKVEKKKKSHFKLGIKVKVILGIVIASLVIFGSYKVLQSVTGFFSEHTILFFRPVSVSIHSPLEVISIAEHNRRKSQEEMKASVDEIVSGIIFQPVKNKIDEFKQQAVRNINPDEFFDTVWANESTRGKNNTASSLAAYCEKLGMWNEVGYNPHVKFCFKDKQEAQLFINYWVYKNGKEKTMSQALCFYNTGVYQNTCAYSEGRMSEAN